MAIGVFTSDGAALVPPSDGAHASDPSGPFDASTRPARSRHARSRPQLTLGAPIDDLFDLVLDPEVAASYLAIASCRQFVDEFVGAARPGVPERASAFGGAGFVVAIAASVAVGGRRPDSGINIEVPSYA